MAHGQAGQFFPSERFSSGLINDVCQDKYGYIWIATENGLNKFDGYRFTTYLSLPDEEPASRVTTTPAIVSSNTHFLRQTTHASYPSLNVRTANFCLAHQEWDFLN